MLKLKPLSIDWLVAGANIPSAIFIAHHRLATHELAHALDSLVRVSRRVRWNIIVIIVCAKQVCPRCMFHAKKALPSKRAIRQMPCTKHNQSSNSDIPYAQVCWHSLMDDGMQSKMHCTHTSKLSAAWNVQHQAIKQVHSNLTYQVQFHLLSNQQFQALLTFFSKSFSLFPHGTCLLSVSNPYLA